MKMSLPFYSNLKSDTHCFQAALKITLKYFFPKKKFSYKILDKMSYHPNLKYWTWPMAGLLSLVRFGLKVKFHSHLDYQKFAKDGEQYLSRIYPEEHVRTIVKFTADMQREMEHANKMIKLGIFSNRKITLEEVERKFANSGICIFLINSNVLSRKRGYVGHFVVLTGIDKNYVQIHDPGLPPRQNRKIPRKLFEKSWRYPKDEYELAIISK